MATAVATGLAKMLGTDDVRVCSDAHMLASANLDEKHPILVIAGTGSVVITRKPDGTHIVTGGWGPILGDEGGAYRLVLEGIRRADEDEQLRELLARETGKQTLAAVHQWLTYRKPVDVAPLAIPILRAADGGNAGARAALLDQAQKLAALARHGFDRAGRLNSLPAKLSVFFTGGLSESDSYANALSEALTRAICPVQIESPTFQGHRAAFALRSVPDGAPYVKRPITELLAVAAEPDTEGVDTQFENFDVKPSREIALLMSISEVFSSPSVQHMSNTIGAIIDAAAACIRAGGRIVYAGAGTSGRLGVLDASECPPTFGVGEDRVIALIAGGDAALRHSIEGAEDDTAAAARDIDAISPRIGANDIVIGITASGTTPYALAAIDRAKVLGAKTGLVACNPVPLDRADFVVALDTGPEVLPGSTRLKAGTATKLVLNQISTGAMAKAGFVFEGRMVGVRPMNKKLRQRCIRIIAELTKEDAAAAEKRLDETGGSIRMAVLMARRGLSLAEAQRRLDAAGGVLRDALEAE